MNPATSPFALTAVGFIVTSKLVHSKYGYREEGLCIFCTFVKHHSHTLYLDYFYNGEVSFRILLRGWFHHHGTPWWVSSLNSLFLIRCLCFAGSLARCKPFFFLLGCQFKQVLRYLDSFGSSYYYLFQDYIIIDFAANQPY